MFFDIKIKHFTENYLFFIILLIFVFNNIVIKQGDGLN